jgi:hypothetical protein
MVATLLCNLLCSMKIYCLEACLARRNSLMSYFFTKTDIEHTDVACYDLFTNLV